MSLSGSCFNSENPTFVRYFIARRLCGQLFFGIFLELLDAAAHVVEFGLAQVLILVVILQNID